MFDTTEKNRNVALDTLNFLNLASEYWCQTIFHQPLILGSRRQDWSNSCCIFTGQNEHNQQHKLNYEPMLLLKTMQHILLHCQPPSSSSFNIFCKIKPPLSISVCHMGIRNLCNIFPLTDIHGSNNSKN